MSGSSNPRKDLTELEGQTNKLIRKQFVEQLTFLDSRTTAKQELISDLQEFFKKRSEIEATYASSLERLAERMSSKRSQTQKKEPTTTAELLNGLLNETRTLGRERHQLSERVSAEMGARLDSLNKDLQFIHRRVKDITQTCHDDLSRSYKDMVEDLKFYQATCQQAADSEDKLQKTIQKGKLLQPKEDLNQLRASIRKKVKEQSDREAKASELARKMRSKRTVVRNKYVLAVTAANAATQRYFNAELMDILEALDYDFHDGLDRMVRAYVDADQASLDSEKECLERLIGCSESLSFDTDKYKLVEESSSVFIPPPKFRHFFHPSDKVSRYIPQEHTENDLVEVASEVDQLVAQIEEEEKTLQFVQETLAQQKLESEGVKLSDDPATPKQSTLDRKQAGARQGSHHRTSSSGGVGSLNKDNLSFYLDVFQRIRVAQASLNRLESRRDLLRKALHEQETRKMSDDSYALPKLFEGDLVEYVQTTNVAIPVIVSSCIKHIEQFGLTVEGVFRVPGPQALIDELKEGFERGEDPLSSNPQSRDINAVASVMKEYFRRLKSPLFPESMYKSLVSCGRISDMEMRASALTRQLRSIQDEVREVMEFLFRFLKRVSQHHLVTKMTSSNLAVVFGPTLTRSPPGSEEFALSASPCINTVMQTCIDYCDKIFEEIEEEREERNNENDGNVQDNVSDDGYAPSDGGSDYSAYETVEVIAIHDYDARSSEEISFRKGQSIYVVQQTDDGNWWDGFLGSKRGYIPTQYVEVVPYEGPQSPLCDMTEGKDDWIDAEMRQCDLSDSELPEPPVIVTVSDPDSHTLPEAPESAGSNEEAVDDLEPLPPPPELLPSSTDPLPPPSSSLVTANTDSMDAIDDAVEALSTALNDLENFVVGSNDVVASENEVQQPEQEAETEQHEREEEMEGEVTRQGKSPSEESGKEEQIEESTPASVEKEKQEAPPVKQSEEQEAEEKQQPQHEEQAVQQQPNVLETHHNRHPSPTRPKVFAKPPHLPTKPFKPFTRVSTGGNLTHSTASSKPSKLVLRTSSGSNIFGQIEGVLTAAVAKGPDRIDTSKEVTSPTSLQSPHPVTHGANPLVGKKGKKPKPPVPAVPAKPATAAKPRSSSQGQAVAALASQIQAKANVFRKRPTYGRREDEADSLGEGNSAASTPDAMLDFNDEAGITHL